MKELYKGKQIRYSDEKARIKIARLEFRYSFAGYPIGVVVSYRGNDLKTFSNKNLNHASGAIERAAHEDCWTRARNWALANGFADTKQ